MLPYAEKQLFFCMWLDSSKLAQPGVGPAGQILPLCPVGIRQYGPFVHPGAPLQKEDITERAADCESGNLPSRLSSVTHF